MAAGSYQNVLSHSASSNVVHAIARSIGLVAPGVPGKPSEKPVFCGVTAVETDPVVAQQFLRVVWMLDAASTLFRPHTVRRIAKALLTRDRNSQPIEDTEPCHSAARSRAKQPLPCRTPTRIWMSAEPASVVREVRSRRSAASRW